MWLGASNRAFVPAAAPPGVTFNFFISPTGSLSNSGTSPSSPWPITALNYNSKGSVYTGKNVGLIGDQGSYDVSPLMTTNEGVAVLNIMGGTSSSPTFIGSCNSAGIYTPRLATIDAKGASGQYGGGSSNTSPVMGQNGSPGNLGWWIVDGIVFVGWSYWAFHVGTAPSGGPRITNWFIQNCEFTNGNGGLEGVNCGPIVIYASVNGTVTNCKIHDNVAAAPDHYEAIMVWGLGSTPNSTNTEISFCTIYNSYTGIFGKNGNVDGVQAFNNYIDCTNYSGAVPIFDFTGQPVNSGTSLTTDSFIHHNICIASGGNGTLGLYSDENDGGWSQNVSVYSNTCIQTAPGNIGAGFFTQTAGTHPIKFYNNLLPKVSGVSFSNYGMMACPIDGFTLCDYNLYGYNSFYSILGGQSQFYTGNGSGGILYANLAAWAAAITAHGGGATMEANSVVDTSAQFVGTGTLAQQYQLAATATARGRGRIGGVSSGAVCDLGAWDGQTQIGSSF